MRWTERAVGGIWAGVKMIPLLVALVLLGCGKPESKRYFITVSENESDRDPATIECVAEPKLKDGIYTFQSIAGPISRVPAARCSVTIRNR